MYGYTQNRYLIKFIHVVSQENKCLPFKGKNNNNFNKSVNMFIMSVKHTTHKENYLLKK